MILTSSCRWGRGHSKNSIVTGHLLEGNVTVPFLLSVRPPTGLEHEMVGISLGLGIPDQGDMVISGWVFL